MATQNKEIIINGIAIDPNKKRKKTWKTIIFIISFTILPLFNFLLFYVYVNLSSFTLAFQEHVDGTIIWGFTQFKGILDDFAKSDGEMLHALINTLKTFGVSLCMYPVSIIVSYFLYKKVRGHNVFRVLFFLPQIISSIVWTYFYKQFVSSVGPIAGIVQDIWNFEKPIGALTNSKTANTFVLLHMIWMGFPGNIIIWSGTFARIPESVVEYAKLDGVGWVREMVQIILPMVWPTFSLFLILQLAGLFSASGSVFLLTSDPTVATGVHTETLSNWFYRTMYAGGGTPSDNSLSQMSALGMMITVVACTLSLTARKWLVKLVPDVEF
ncbi:MAG: sugar ABC transporter permease [Clostridiales bacterium]|nr:sugar ABC transporter permease [Clostridiales bacterium]